MRRLGVVMTPLQGEQIEEGGVLNPASGRTPDGRLHLLPRLVTKENVSRVGLAEVEFDDAGVPRSVSRKGVVLAPDAGFERGANNAGVEDPRVTWLEALGLHVMAYVAYGPLGPRVALAISADLTTWRRLGPVHFCYEPELDADLNLYANKDAVLFPEPVPGPDGRPAIAMLHRPMWDLGLIRSGEMNQLPAGLTDDRPGIWISYVSLESALQDPANIVCLRGHRLVALSEYDFESLKIGAGPPPIRVPEGWLLIHHGVAGEQAEGWELAQQVSYAAGAMLLDAADPSRVLDRTAEPILTPDTPEERHGTVSNVVFPTAIEPVDGTHYVFYGMADARIGVAELVRHT